ncbi:MAG: hypothetical protein A2664_04720 [Candidatus Taylorbacteria bacterium RIFCSPHIGHO2_01_FULL_46_22b]|uniref:Vitamin K epoxide reductase domain-containing protein n=1 Tax=Candidatus Taylorbacteria bacterium RIFCSPHIGHO2_01_FULL_46_22b TaxID=1802301 RepID=A0A1G2M6U2_9BACT|nr:MAG: hypothetical protein A2664_04720 [Candidatus Taylorbacteria bacterium RIFCSPHIGHO2_01_FULL_46_22b]
MKLLRKVTSWGPWALLLVSLFGFADTAYLTVKHFKGEIPPCVLFSGCDTVTSSSYSTIGPIPIALLGLLFYFAVFLLTLIFLDRRNNQALKLIFFAAIPAFLFSMWLLYVQLFVLHAACIYCMFSVLTSSLVFIVSTLGYLQISRSPAEM